MTKSQRAEWDNEDYAARRAHVRRVRGAVALWERTVGETAGRDNARHADEIKTGVVARLLWGCEAEYLCDVIDGLYEEIAALEGRVAELEAARRETEGLQREVATA